MPDFRNRQLLGIATHPSVLYVLHVFVYANVLLPYLLQFVPRYRAFLARAAPLRLAARGCSTYMIEPAATQPMPAHSDGGG